MSESPFRKQNIRTKTATQQFQQQPDQARLARLLPRDTTTVLEDDLGQYIQCIWGFDQKTPETDSLSLNLYRLNDELERWGPACYAKLTGSAYENLSGESSTALNLTTCSSQWAAMPSKELFLAFSDDVVNIHPAFKMMATTVSATILDDATGLIAASIPESSALVREFADVLPSELSSIKRAISASEWILSLPDNWDDDGSGGYNFATLKSAISFLVDYAVEILNKEDVLIQPPRITPGPDGSIDLHWVENKYGLLLNFEPEPSDVITFYGEEGNGNYIKGKLKRGEINRAILLFLMGQD